MRKIIYGKNDLTEGETYLDWRRFGQAYLEEKGVRDGDLDARFLMDFVTGFDRNTWFMRQKEVMPAEEAERYQGLLRRRAKHVPLQHLTGGAWFYGYYFKVNEHVLIPRQDTEVLVEEALQRLQTDGEVLDMCTGSGCILLTLMKEKACQGWGSDISGEALEVARENAAALGLQPVFTQGDLFIPVEGKFDMIVSNPPYIQSQVIGTLDAEVRDHEPLIALDGHEDGLYFYKRIISEAGAYLKQKGWLCLEIGYDQGKEVQDLLAEAGYEEITLVKDLAGLDRVAMGRFGG